MNCADCKYGHDVGYALLCWGQKNAPKVDPDHICDSWKPNGEDDGWIWTCGVKYPDPWVSVQVYLPEQEPMPTVREGYVIDEGEGVPTGWFIPALREGRLLYEIEAWKPMSDPPKMK